MKKFLAVTFAVLMAFQLFACKANPVDADLPIWVPSVPIHTTAPTQPSTQATASTDAGTVSTVPPTAATKPTTAPTVPPTTLPPSTAPGTTAPQPTEPEPTVPAPPQPQFTTTAFPNSLKKDGPLTTKGLPSVGSPKLLVIPVNLDNSKKTSAALNDIKTAFTGTEQSTGWQSVESYYSTSSYGKLNLDCVVLDEWFTPSRTASEYESYYDEENDADGSILILREALAYYESKLDFNDYDYDKDGYIDSVWLVYNCDVDYESDDSLYWAFVSWEYEETTYDGLKAYNYAFAGTDFMHEDTDMYPTEDILVDSHTYVHETAHLMGVDDYYDYDSKHGPQGGTYSADMMDSTLGDHGVITKLLLGWVSPTVVTGTGTGNYSLSSFTTTGDFLLVSDHEITSIYDEYFLIEFYTNDGLNANDSPILDDKYEVAEGIRIMHVDARICYNFKGEIDWNEGDSYSTGFLYDNSDTGKLFQNNLRADYSTKMEEYLYPESLYRDGSVVFGEDIWQKHRYHSGSALNFTLEVLDIQNDLCQFEITLH
ncbi:MAG: hypothetical protein E7462_00175 [Ruminococcaceae bacterium]|nr:hypothetical protein [Oscillospiraceae bacterium]